MNRDFEFKQLLRAYRAGIITEATFESEMAALDMAAPTVTAGVVFRRWGKPIAASARQLCDARSVSGGRVQRRSGFPRMGKALSTDCIRSGVRMISEREAYHTRIFERRLKDLGAECKAPISEASRKITETLSDPAMTDNQKLLYIANLTADPEAFFKPVLEFAENLKDDLETKELFKLYVQDELSSAKWLMYACEALNGPAPAASAQMENCSAESLL